MSHHSARMWRCTGGTRVNTHSTPVLLRGELVGGSLTGNTAQSVFTCRSCTELERQNLPTFFCVVRSMISTVRGFSSGHSDQGYAQCVNVETHIGLHPSLTCFIHLRTVSVLLCTSGAHSAVSCSPMHCPMTIHSRGSAKGTLKIARTRANAWSHCG